MLGAAPTQAQPTGAAYKVLGAAFLAALALVAVPTGAGAAGSTQTHSVRRSSGPPRLWAVQVRPGAHGWFDRSLLKRVRRDGINALALRIAPLGRRAAGTRTLDSVRSFAAAEKLYLIAVLPAGKPRTPAAKHAFAACSSHRFARLRCAVRRPSLSAAVRLAHRRGSIRRVVVVYVKGPRSFSGAARLPRSLRRRILLIAPLYRNLDASAWGTAIGQTAASASAYMGVAPQTRRATPALRRFAGLLAGGSASAAGVLGDPAALSAPTGAKVGSATQTSIAVTWNAPAGRRLAGYRMFRNGSEVGTSASTGYSFTGLTCGNSYSLGVAAYDAAGDVSGTATTSGSTSACPGPPAPPTPSGLATSAVTQTSMTLSWSSSPDAGVVGYRLYLNGSQVNTSSLTSYAFTGLSCGTSYTVGVAAYDVFGDVSSTATVLQTTAACAAPPPGTANLWVDGGTGLCSRSATPVAYDASTACGTFNAAYQAASQGDLVLVRDGTYGAQSFSTKATSGWTQPVTFEAANPLGATIQLTGTSGTTLDLGAADWIEIKGFDILSSSTGISGAAITASSSTTDTSTNVTIADNDINVGHVDGGPSISLYAEQSWTITGNTIGPEVPASISCSPNCGSPEGIRIGKPTMAAPSCGAAPTEACDITISNNLIQYAVRDCSLWPSSGYGSCPGATCANANGCHMDGIHIWGIDGATIEDNRLYGVECQGIFIEPTNNSLNTNVTIVGNAISSLAGGCSDKAIYINATSQIAGTWNIGFNSAPGLLDLGDGFGGDQPGTVFNLYGNYMHLYLSDANGNAIPCTTAPNANTTINFEFNSWSNGQACSGTDSANTSTPAWVDASPAPAMGLDMRLASTSGTAFEFVPCALLTVGSGCPAGSDGFGNRWPTVTANAGADQTGA